jgi:hypothetical protein
MSTSETATLPAPTVDWRPAVRDKWACEFEAFQRLLPQLLETHRGEYVVIHAGRVVDSGQDDLALALRFFAKHGNVPIHVGLVADEPEPLTRIPHYREWPASGEPDMVRS